MWWKWWEAAATVLGALLTGATLTSVIWRGVTWLWRRALREAQQVALDDLAATKAAVDAICGDLAEHSEADAANFERLNRGQEQIIEGLVELKEGMTAIATSQAVANTNIEWLKQRHRTGEGR